MTKQSIPASYAFVDILLEEGVHMDTNLHYADRQLGLTPAERATLQANGFLRLPDVGAEVAFHEAPLDFAYFDVCEVKAGKLKRTSYSLR